MLLHHVMRRSRRTLRSDAAPSVLDTAGALEIPDELRTAGSLNLESRKMFKREHEHDLYRSIRKARGSEEILVTMLREEWQRLLLPVRVQTEADCSSRREVRALSGVTLRSQPAVYLSVCCGSRAAQELLTNELQARIVNGDWQELWVLLGQIDAALKNIPNTAAVLPWWVLACAGQASPGVAEQVDLAAREESGGADNPLDASDEPPSTYDDPNVKREVGPTASDGRAKGKAKAKETASAQPTETAESDFAGDSQIRFSRDEGVPNWSIVGFRDLATPIAVGSEGYGPGVYMVPPWIEEVHGPWVVVMAEELVSGGAIDCSAVLTGIQLNIDAHGAGAFTRSAPDPNEARYDFSGDWLLGTLRGGAFQERSDIPPSIRNVHLHMYWRPDVHTFPYTKNYLRDEEGEPYTPGGEVEFTVDGPINAWPTDFGGADREADRKANLPVGEGKCLHAHIHLATPEHYWRLYMCHLDDCGAVQTELRARFPGSDD